MAKAKQGELAEGETPAVDPIAMLVADHREVSRMFEQYERLKDDEDADDLKSALVEQICASLRIHMQLEEEIFYPAVRAAVGDEDMVDEAVVEHDSGKRLMDDLETMVPDEDLYDAKVKVLGEYIEHHVKEEETEMFQKAAAAGLDLATLGREMAAMRRELEDEYGLVDEDDDEDGEED